jgi:bifunctional N-acetylglucosamine-1-phosphate-uridyltransferase/glucosamine-1-phosphate-acetyltransferase GlmU-like protein
VTQINVERSFHQAHTAVVRYQPHAQPCGYGRLATDDQQTASRIFKRLDALRYGRLADAQRQCSFFETALTDDSIEYGQRTVIQSPHKLHL